MKKVSFDFDDTLDRRDVQNLLIDIRARFDIDVWVFTSRLDDSHAPSPHWNNDLKDVIKRLDIPFDKVVFCNDIPKAQFVNDYRFDIHIDDDWNDCDDISAVSKTKTVKCRMNPGWKDELLSLLL